MDINKLISDFESSAFALPEQSSALERYNSGDSYRKLRRDGYSMNDLLVEMLYKSAIYQQAYNLFSNDSRYGQPFLEQLNVIVNSSRIPEKGGNRVVENNITNAYNNATSQISSLVAEYNNFKNSLPETQIEQDRYAGINSDITGEGVQPSSMAQTGVEQAPEVSVPTEMDIATQAINGINTFLNLCTTFSSAFTSLSKLGPELNIAGLQADSLKMALDLAEQEGWHKQQLYDYLATQMGYDPRPDNKFSSAYDKDGDVIDSLDANQYAAGAVSDKKRVDAEIMNGPVVVGHEPDGSPIEKKGLEVFKDMSRFQMAMQYSRSVEGAIRAEIAKYTSYLSESLQQEASMSQNAYSSDYYGQLDGSLFAKLDTAAKGLDVQSASLRVDNQEIANRILALQEGLQILQNATAAAKWQLTNHWMELSKTDDTYSIFANYALFGMPMDDTHVHLPADNGVSKSDVSWYTSYFDTIINLVKSIF